MDIQQYWEPDDNQRRPLSDKDRAAVEKKLNIKLPAFLVHLFQIQNGGFLQDEEAELFAINTRTSTTETVLSARSFFEDSPPLVELVETELGDSRKVIVFGCLEVDHTYLSLDYNTLSTNGEPIVSVIDISCGYCDPTGLPVEDFLTGLLRSDDAPLFEISERDQLEQVFDESFSFDPEIDADDLVVGTVRQTLCETAASFVLFVEESAGLQRLTRCEIFKPLDPNRCLIVRTDDERLPWRLQLCPEVLEEEAPPNQDYEENSITWQEAIQRPNGEWRNRETFGEPSFAELNAADRETLLAVRERVLQGELSPQGRAAEQLLDKLHEMDPEKLDSLTPHLMRQMVDLMTHLLEGSAAPPEELRASLDQITRIRDDLSNEAPLESAIDPEIASLLTQLMNPPDDVDADNDRR